jgi:hypothetical protein
MFGFHEYVMPALVAVADSAELLPIHTAVGKAVVVIVGNPLTVTMVLLVPVQLLLSVPVT